MIPSGAGRELESLRPPAAASTARAMRDWEGHSLFRGTVRAGSSLLFAGWPLLVLLSVMLLVFWQDLFAGRVYFGSDTLAFYYPLTAWYADQLRSGHLPFWIPYIFGGYPLFADGEIGMV